MASIQSVFGPIRAIRRSGVIWLVSLAALVVLTMAFWPPFRDSAAAARAIDEMPSAFVQAFGLREFGTPAGFLRGNLYDFFLPLLLAGAAIGFANSLSSSEEDTGRLELFLSQPMTRQASFLGRAVAGLVWLAIVLAGVSIAQLGGDAVFGLSIGADRLAATLVLTGLLALFHGALAFAVAGIRPKPGVVLSVSLIVAVGGCIVAMLFPLSPDLASWVHVSPWDWALGGDPLANGGDAWRYLALGAPSVALVVMGLAGFTHRDVHAA